MGVFVSEYWKTVQLTRADVDKWTDFNAAVYDASINKRSISSISSTISVLSTILAFVLTKSPATAAAVATAIYNVCASVVGGEKATLESVALAGERGLSSISRWMGSQAQVNAGIQLVELKMWVLEYRTEGLIICQNEPTLLRVKYPGGWTTP